MTILDNKLVKKYFGCQCTAPDHHHEWCYGNMSMSIVAAMQEPIRKTDWYLCVTEHDGDITVEEAHGNISLFNRWHPACLRLPDRFQPTEKQECDILGRPCPRCGKPEEFHSPKQPPEPEKCVTCGSLFAPNHPLAQHCTNPPLPKEVEEKIDDIELKVWKFGKANVGEACSLGKELRELCELVRKAK